VHADIAATLFALFVVLALLEVPIAFSLGLSALATIALHLPERSVAIVATQTRNALLHEPLMAIPLFIVAGLAFARSGVATRLVRFARLLVGPLPGGLGVVVVLVAIVFAAISGSGPAAVAALGAVLIPALAANNYPRGFAAALVAASGGLGIIIPPSIAMVIYGVVARVDILQLFVGGILPGLVVGGALIAYLLVVSIRRGYGSREVREGPPALGRAFVAALPGLLAPVVILACIYSGFSSPTKVAAVAVAYAFGADLAFYRDIRWGQVLGVFREAAVLSSQVLVVVAAASLFAWVLNYTEITQAMVGWLQGMELPAWLMLVLINAVLLLAGGFLDAISIYYIFVPILLPIITPLGISKLHFGVVMTVNMAIGQVTPPVGVNLFVACSLAKIPLNRIARTVFPLVVVEVAALLLITYLPWLTTWLPSFLR